MNAVEAECRLYTADFDVLKSGVKSHVAIICHDQPDPDCLASALAMQSIAEKMGLSSTIYYGGEIGHTQNRVMVNVLNISAHRLDSTDEEDSKTRISEILEQSYIVLVDVACFGKQPCESIVSFVSKTREPDLVIDHHDLNPKISCPYIRRPFGSCATIMFEVLQEMDIAISPTLATALYVGISTDTANLKAEGASEHDRAAFEALKTLVDPETYEKIFNYPKPTSILEMRKQVYNSLKVDGSLAVASAGLITPNQRSLIAEICDELLQIDSIETAVVMAIVDEGLKSEKWLVASFRSAMAAINMQDFIGKTFGKKYGGGRKGAGGAKIPLEPTFKAVIDSLRNGHANEAEMEAFLRPIFQVFTEKVKSENSNI